VSECVGFSIPLDT